MTAPAIIPQTIAAFALHAAVQLPLLALATYLAIRFSRSSVRVAYGFWITTLVLALFTSAVSTALGYRAARAQQENTGRVLLIAGDDLANLPALQREPAWQRILHRHIHSHGVEPFTFALPPQIARIFAAAYIAVVLLGFVRLFTAWHRSRKLRRNASGIIPARILTLFKQSLPNEKDSLVIFMSEEISGPLVAGVLHPALLLPTDAVASMSDSELEAVFAHETAHIRRRDPLGNFACSLLFLPLAFHPVAHWIAARIRQTREMACDEIAVTHLGAAPYAHALLHVAEQMQRAAAATKETSLGLGLLDADTWPARRYKQLNTSNLELFGTTGVMEERMRTMMQSKRIDSRKAVLARAAVSCAVFAAGLTATSVWQVQPTLAAENNLVQPAQATSATNSTETKEQAADHQVQEALNQVRVQTDLANSRANHNALNHSSDTPQNFNFDFNFKGPDMSAFHIDMKDFKGPDMTAFQQNMFDMQKNMQLHQKDLQAMQARIKEWQNSPEWKTKMEHLQAQINSPEFQERIRKQQESARQMADKLNSPEFRKHLEDIARRSQNLQATPQPNPQPTLLAQNEPMPLPAQDTNPGQSLHVKSNIMAGQIVSKVQPIYPPVAKEAKVSGAVVLQALIGEDGSVENLKVIQSPDDSLSQSATDAVKQWKYKPYLLNGKPTVVETTITVTYSLAP